MTGPVEAGTRILLSTSTATSSGPPRTCSSTLRRKGRPCASAPTPRTIARSAGALDEVYIYASALGASDIELLYDDVTAAPTVTDAPTGDFFEGSLVAYYPFDDGLRDAAGAHHAWLLGESPAAAVQPVGKDRGARYASGDAGFLELPAAVTEDIGRDYDRTICVLARIDSWAGGYLFNYGGAEEACDGEGWYRCLADGSIRAGVGCTSCDDCVATYNYTAYLAWSETTSIRCNLATETYTLRDAAGVVLDQGKMNDGACHYIPCGASFYSYSYSYSYAPARRRLDGAAGLVDGL